MFIPSVYTRPILAVWFLIFIALGASPSNAAGLSFDTVFKGRKQFDALVAQADKWKGLPIGQRSGLKL